MEQKGKVRFIRVRGRVVPVRTKDMPAKAPLTRGERVGLYARSGAGVGAAIGYIGGTINSFVNPAIIPLPASKAQIAKTVIGSTARTLGQSIGKGALIGLGVGTLAGLASKNVKGQTHKQAQTGRQMLSSKPKALELIAIASAGYLGFKKLPGAAAKLGAAFSSLSRKIRIKRSGLRVVK